MARAGFEAFGRGDFDGAAAFFAPDVVWEMTGDRSGIADSSDITRCSYAKQGTEIAEFS